MSKIISTAIMLFALSILPASAQNARSFVSAHGSDTAACTLAAPCRTFAAAYAATNASGEIDVLDAAGYGALTITKAISIVNDGVGTAGVIVPSGGVGITINAGPNDAVSLRGLSIDGEGSGFNGIQFNAGKSLTVENSTIRHLSNGIQFAPNASSRLSIANSSISDNSAGMVVAPSGSGAVTIVLNRVEVNNNTNHGIEVDGNAGTTLAATVTDSVVANNGDVGIFAFNIVNAPTTVTVVRSVSANNNTGIDAAGTGVTLRLANSTVTGNSLHGWIVGSGVLGTYGDNYIDSNGPNTGSLTLVTKQ